MESEQIWFFLWENVTAKLNTQYAYKQGFLTLSDVKKGISLSKSLEIAGVDNVNIENHTFWIHSNSMKAAVQLLNDNSIQITWKLYCEKDSVVTIHIRPAADPSPNTSKAASHQTSLAERRKVSGARRKVSEIFIRNQLDHVTTGLDALSLEPIKDLVEGDKVTISTVDGKTETFSKEYLLGWVTAQITAGKDVASITVTSFTQNKRPKEITLTDDIWQTSLLRGPWKTEFQQLWEISKHAIYKRNEALDNLNATSDFSEMSKQFIRDLRCFGKDTKAQARLNETKHEFFLGGKYFSASTVAKILELPVGHSTLKEELQNLVRRKVEREHQNDICASHDLAPLFEAALGIDWAILKGQETLMDKPNQKGGEKKGFGNTMNRGLKKARSTMFSKKIDD